MDAVEAVTAKIKLIVPNKGNMMLFIVAYNAWVAVMTWIFWRPIPAARTQLDMYGTSRVLACLTVIAYYVKCAMLLDLLAAIIAILRASAIFLGLLLLFLIGAAILWGGGDGYKKDPPVSQN